MKKAERREERTQTRRGEERGDRREERGRRREEKRQKRDKREERREKRKERPRREKPQLGIENADTRIVWREIREYVEKRKEERRLLTEEWADRRQSQSLPMQAACS